MAHTKGPWITDDFSILCQEHKRAIAEVWGRVGEDLDNATLIAAAPEMLAELETSLGWLRHLMLWHDEPNCGDINMDKLEADIETLTATIAKARGE